MAKIFGEKSKYLIGMDYLHRFAAFFVYLLLTCSVYFYLKASFSGEVSLLGILIVSLIFIWFFIRIDEDLKMYIRTALNYKTGRKAEYAIVRELKITLPDDFLVFQDIMLNKNRGNIDMVVVGRTGIFALEVKSHKGNITFKNNELLRNGFKLEKNLLNQAMRNALGLKEYLDAAIGKDFFVNPVLVFENDSAFMKFGFDKIKNVSVVQRKLLNELIIREKNALSEDEVTLLKGAIIKLLTKNKERAQVNKR